MSNQIIFVHDLLMRYKHRPSIQIYFRIILCVYVCMHMNLFPEK